MTVTAESHKHYGTLWRGANAWDWAALKSGRLGTTKKNIWRCRYDWQLHFTPIHVARYGKQWVFGLCLGRRVVYVQIHH